MNITISTHDVHREQLRHLQLGPDGYISRVTKKVKKPEKFVAVLVYLAFRAQYGFDEYESLREYVGEKLAEADITSLSVTNSRPHNCETDKTYRIDDFVRGIQEYSRGVIA